jgi:hypothetical protein
MKSVPDAVPAVTLALLVLHIAAALKHQLA